MTSSLLVAFAGVLLLAAIGFVVAWVALGQHVQQPQAQASNALQLEFGMMEARKASVLLSISAAQIMRMLEMLRAREEEAEREPWRG